MRAMLSGVSGSLFPGRYLVDRLATDARIDRPVAATGVALRRWWSHVDRTCGPATGVRALFDLVAMPLAALLEFHAREAAFMPRHAAARLEAAGGAAVGLLVTRWANRVPEIMRDALAAARDADAAWCLVVAPPYVSLVDARAGWTRRSIDFCFPHVLDDPAAVAAFLALMSAPAFESRRDALPPVDALVIAAARFQDRVGEDLHRGVRTALGALMRALAREPAPADRRFDEALTLVYRVLFLLFVESRDLVPSRHPAYGGAYAVASLCETALTRPSARGLWAGLAAITRLLRHGCHLDDLDVRPFNGRLFARGSAPSLERRRARSAGREAERDAAMADVLRAVVTRQAYGAQDRISYADLGVEQLGSVYERVLDLDPETLDGRAPRPEGARERKSTAHRATRKQTGTFYTPRALTEFVVRRTLAPLVAHATSDRILSLRIVDPAMGSGAFLVAACRYLASAYERALVDEGRIADYEMDDERRAEFRRDVARSCLYGVDRNPTAVHLAQLSLWLTTLARDKPLSFLEHRLRSGDSLVGASPDDLRYVIDARRRSSARTLFDEGFEEIASQVAAPLAAMARCPDDTIADVRRKEAQWARLVGRDSPAAAWRAAADLWCARWFWHSGPEPSSNEVRAAIDALIKSDATLRASHLTRLIAAGKSSAAAQRFFHWPLEFAEVFYDERGGFRLDAGFDAVIGNPPWEMLRADHGGNGHAGRLVRFIRDSGLYPSCDRGHLNLYQPFIERALSLARPGGRVGLVVPWGLATDDGAASLRARLFDRARTDLIVELDNAAALFPVHRGLRFMVIVASPGEPTRETRAHFGVTNASQIEALDDEGAEHGERVRLTPALLESVSGPARRIPDVRRSADLDLLIELTARYPALGSDAGWAARFGRELNATEDRVHFGDTGLPIVEGKHIEPFRVTGHSHQHVSIENAAALLPDRRFDRPRLAYRDVSGVGNKLALIAAVIPSGVVTTHTLFCLRSAIDVERQWFLCALFNSFVLNLVARMLMGSHLTTSLIERLPVPAWRGSAEERRIARLARHLSHGAGGRRRAWAELQAGVARLYGLDHRAFASIADGFPLIAWEDRVRAVAAFDNLRPTVILSYDR